MKIDFNGLNTQQPLSAKTFLAAHMNNFSFEYSFIGETLCHGLQQRNKLHRKHKSTSSFDQEVTEG